MLRSQRKAEQSFYMLETALDEIESGLNREVQDALELAYSDVLIHLYRTEGVDGKELTDNETANAVMGGRIVRELVQGGRWKRDLNMHLKTVDPESVTVSIGKITLQRVYPEMGGERICGIDLYDCCLTSETNRGESSITVDFCISIPWIQFFEEGEPEHEVEDVCRPPVMRLHWRKGRDDGNGK